jgi:hypothetical protein
MIRYRNLDTIRRSGNHLEVMSVAVSAITLAATSCGTQWLSAGPAVGPAWLWNTIPERTI